MIQNQPDPFCIFCPFCLKKEFPDATNMSQHPT